MRQIAPKVKPPVPNQDGLEFLVVVVVVVMVSIFQCHLGQHFQ